MIVCSGVHDTNHVGHILVGHCCELTIGLDLDQLINGAKHGQQH